MGATLIIGALLGVLARLILALIGGRYDGLIMAALILGDVDNTFVLGFLASFFGCRGLSLISEVLQPVVADPNTKELSAMYVREGFGPALIKEWTTLDSMITGIVIVMGIFIVPVASRYSGLAMEFNGWVFKLSGIMMVVVWLVQIYRLRSWKRVPYICGILVVGIYTILMSHAGLGMFMVLVILNLLFLDMGSIGGQVPEQEWDSTKLVELEFDWSMVTWGFLSALLIGVPSSVLVSIVESNETPEEIRLRNHIVASATNEAVSLIMWFILGSSRAAISDTLDKTIGQSGDWRMMVCFALIMIGCQIMTWLLIEDATFFYWCLDGSVPIWYLSLGAFIINTIIMLTLGVEWTAIPLVLGGALLIKGSLKLIKVGDNCLLSAVTVLPLYSIYGR